MKYKEAMVTDKERWTNAVDEEHRRMVDNNVWCPVKLSEVPKGAKILASTWVCTLKSNGTKRAKINGRGYEQVDVLYNDNVLIHTPVTNETSVRRINDVKGSFLKDNLDRDIEWMYMKVLQGFKKLSIGCGIAVTESNM
eukprot:15339685-Ditylum_brightwellii.AAC.3